MNLTELSRERILFLDGAMGTVIQRYGLDEDDFRKGYFEKCEKQLQGNNECLNLTRPELIADIHRQYILAGADIIETNTFSANRISQAEYACGGWAREMALAGARIARKTADEMAAELGRPVFVAGSVGPTSKSLSLATDADNVCFRAVDFDSMCDAYCEQVQALVEGGIDLLLIETCFDALNVKSILYALHRLGLEGKLEVIVSMSVNDRSGRSLTGQTIRAFYDSVSHYPLLAFGLNCSLGAKELAPLVSGIAEWCPCLVSCYPNAGLPNGMGGYDQSPEEMAGELEALAASGTVNIIGGCCGTTPEHIAAAVKRILISGSNTSGESSVKYQPRKAPEVRRASLRVSGLESYELDKNCSNFVNVGERTNVAGSRKFARLIASREYETALEIAAGQISGGANIIDINMDDAMLDNRAEMVNFLRYISNDPAVSRAALMIDSSDWDTLQAGLKNAQGKCIVNSISLKEGQEKFLEKAREIHALGAAMVVMAFDEEGQAVTYDRKTAICERAYKLLTDNGIPPTDIIFDCNILSVGTGIAEHRDYARDFIEAVRWIKANLPGALTSGGVSNLSFAFRGNNAVREAMHSVFLYHAIQAGLDMAIVNPSMLQIYDEIEPSLLKACEDVILNTDEDATERLIEKAEALKAEASNEGNAREENIPHSELSVAERIAKALVSGQKGSLEADVREAMNELGSAVAVVEGPLMAGMEKVGELFGEGRMFLPQVIKSAKLMRDAVAVLEPFMSASAQDESNTQDSAHKGSRPKIVIATVKGDVHDIGKNITAIVLSCNGFDVTDLGVMVDRETILAEAGRINADIIAVSGLITPSLFQMEEICREMSARKMSTPLFIGGATTSALHTAVKLAPLYEHVFYGSDASASALMAKKYMMNAAEFEAAEHEEQAKLRALYESSKDIGNSRNNESSEEKEMTESRKNMFPSERAFALRQNELEKLNIPVCELSVQDVLPYFDWRSFFAIWGIKTHNTAASGPEIDVLRKDAEAVLNSIGCRIVLGAEFYAAKSSEDDRILLDNGRSIAMFRRNEKFGKNLSLCDFLLPDSSDTSSPFGVFAISVHGRTHESGCGCLACNNDYDAMLDRIVLLTLAEAASSWMDAKLEEAVRGLRPEGAYKVIKPAAGYSSMPDHTLKKDFLEMLPDSHKLGIQLTESYAMQPDASICGAVFIHEDAAYPEIRRASAADVDNYAQKRGMTEAESKRFLSHLL